MGMDVYATTQHENGKVDIVEDGPYFRACVWSWRPLAELIRELDRLARDASDGKLCIVNDPQDKRWHSNDGMIVTAVEAGRIAEALRGWLAAGDEGVIMESEVQVAPDGHFLRKGEQCKDSRSAYRITRDHIQEFVRFCREIALEWHGFAIC